VSDADPEPDEALIQAACEEHGLGGDDLFLVANLVGRPRATWPACCGQGCRPCMDDVAAAAETVLRRRRST
jgi:hypothetical protein